MSTRGSDASRPPSRSRFAILTPSSGNSRNNIEHQSLSSESLKRKRDSPPFPLEELLKPVITIKPQFSLGISSERPLILKPLMLLSREHLSLSSLDLSAPNGEFPAGPGRFFESHIRILDLEGRLRQAPSVLIARSGTSCNVYAIERCQNGLYVVCKLGSWVSIEKLSHLAEACCAPRCRPHSMSEAVTTEIPTTTPQLHKENKRKRLAIEEIQSMVRNRPRTMSATPFESKPSQSQLLNIDHQVSPHTASQQQPSFATASRILPQGSQPGPLDLNTDVQTSAEDIFQNIRSQYVEALYHSKGSLAYFAKGPLSRARASFHLDCDANLEMTDLVDFLKTLVMATPQIDKKYRETIPELVNTMKILVDSDDDEPKPKRKKSKKMKPGKDGLYPGEVFHVKRWWSAHKPEIRDDEGSAINTQEIKYHISYLRTRETQLQMIVLLEILALEAMWPAQDAQDIQLPGMPLEDPSKEPAVGPRSKKRSKHNFPMLVDIHADRLCIWQSTTLDEMKMIAAESQAKNDLEIQKSDRMNFDPLRDFCMDIIVPFFAGRLPELCKSLNLKFGGPVAITPPKVKRPVATTALRALIKPGSIAKRPIQPSAPSSLERVLSNDQLRRRASRRPADVLAQMRSATPATIPGLKREASEPLALGSIPNGDNSLRERSHNILLRSVSSCSVGDVKAQKKAKVEAELKEAISALKKPNRRLVGKSIAEEVEKRTGSSSSPHPRKPRNPVRNAAASKVQVVKATPANYRFKDAVSADPRSYGSFNLPPPKTNINLIPSSSIIPSTAPRNGLRDDLAAFHIASTPASDKVRATPMPAAPKFARPTTNDNFIPPSSPLMSRKPASAPQPHLTIPAVVVAPSSPVLPRLFETPIKQRATNTTTFTDEVMKSTPPEPIYKATSFATPAKEPLPSSAPVAADTTTKRTSHKEPALTIYQRLGWDDDDFDDLA